MHTKIFHTKYADLFAVSRKQGKTILCVKNCGPVRVCLFVCLFVWGKSHCYYKFLLPPYWYYSQQTHTCKIRLYSSKISRYIFAFPRSQKYFYKYRWQFSNLFIFTQDFKMLQVKLARQQGQLKSGLLVHLWGLALRTVTEIHIGNSILKCVLNNHLVENSPKRNSKH